MRCSLFLQWGAGALPRDDIRLSHGVLRRQTQPYTTPHLQLFSFSLGCRNPIVVKLADTERQKQQRRSQKQMTGMQYAFQPSMVRRILRYTRPPFLQSSRTRLILRRPISPRGRSSSQPGFPPAGGNGVYHDAGYGMSPYGGTYSPRLFFSYLFFI